MASVVGSTLSCCFLFIYLLDQGHVHGWCVPCEVPQAQTTLAVD